MCRTSANAARLIENDLVISDRSARMNRRNGKLETTSGLVYGNQQNRGRDDSIENLDVVIGIRLAR
jgi:hypothetical protein